MKRLIINADDFGMNHEVNLGIVRAIADGLVTQASLMVPCPWFEEAVHLALKHRIPVGIHLTATCEWEFYRWRPLTGGRSLGRADGTMHATISAAQAHCDRGELTAEFIAQVERARALGITPQHLDVHMGLIDADVFNALCARYRLPSIVPPELFPVPSPHSVVFTSDTGVKDSPVTAVSLMPRGDKIALLRAYLRGLDDGLHLQTSHPAIDGDECRAMCRSEDAAYPWARDIRVTDFQALTDRETVELARQLGIEKASIGLGASTGAA